MQSHSAILPTILLSLAILAGVSQAVPSPLTILNPLTGREVLKTEPERVGPVLGKGVGGDEGEGSVSVSETNPPNRKVESFSLHVRTIRAAD